MIGTSDCCVVDVFLIVIDNCSPGNLDLIMDVFSSLYHSLARNIILALLGAK